MSGSRMAGSLKRARSHHVASETLMQFVAFVVGDGEYCVDIMRIKEILKPLPVVRVPKAPPFIEGVFELRGAILPVVDLRRRLDLPVTPLRRESKYLVAVIDVGGKRMVVALVVDGVTEPLRVPQDKVRPAPQLAHGDAVYFSGVVHHEERIFMVLDLDAVLSTQEKISLSGLAPKRTP